MPGFEGRCGADRTHREQSRGTEVVRTQKTLLDHFSELLTAHMSYLGALAAREGLVCLKQALSLFKTSLSVIHTQ